MHDALCHSYSVQCTAETKGLHLAKLILLFCYLESFQGTFYVGYAEDLHATYWCTIIVCFSWHLDVLFLVRISLNF